MWTNQNPSQNSNPFLSDIDFTAFSSFGSSSTDTQVSQTTTSSSSQVSQSGLQTILNDPFSDFSLGIITSDKYLKQQKELKTTSYINNNNSLLNSVDSNVSKESNLNTDQPKQETRRLLDWSKGASLFRNLLSQTSEESNNDIEEWSEFDDKVEAESTNFDESNFATQQDSSNFFTPINVDSTTETNALSNPNDSNIQSEIESLKRQLFIFEKENDFEIYSNFFNSESSTAHLDKIKDFVESVSLRKLFYIGRKEIDNWEKLLDQCFQLLDEGVKVLEKVKQKIQDSHLRNKLIDDKKFLTYLKCLALTYCIKKNIEFSLSNDNTQTTVKYINKDLLQNHFSLVNRVDGTWNELTEVVKSILIDEDKFVNLFTVYSERNYDLTNYKCHMCCTSIPTNEYPIYMHSVPYHSYCANLWINRIDDSVAN